MKCLCGDSHHLNKYIIQGDDTEQEQSFYNVSNSFVKAELFHLDRSILLILMLPLKCLSIHPGLTITNSFQMGMSNRFDFLALDIFSSTLPLISFYDTPEIQPFRNKRMNV